MPQSHARQILRSLAVAGAALGLAIGATSCSSDSSDGAKKPDKAETTTTTKVEEGGPADGTTSTSRPDPEDITASAADYEAALVTSFDPNDTTFTKEQVECLAPAWVEAIGVDTFKAGRVTPESIANQTSSITDLEISPEMAEGMVSAMGDCDIDTKELLIRTSTGGTKLSADQQACFDKALTNAAADAALAAQFAGDVPDPKLLASAQACATAGS